MQRAPNKHEKTNKRYAYFGTEDVAGCKAQCKAVAVKCKIVLGYRCDSRAWGPDLPADAPALGTVANAACSFADTSASIASFVSGISADVSADMANQDPGGGDYRRLARQKQNFSFPP